MIRIETFSLRRSDVSPAQAKVSKKNYAIGATILLAALALFASLNTPAQLRDGVAGKSVESGQPMQRIVPMAPMTTDVEVLYGNPDRVGEPFVIRIRELAGGIIPPHRHDTDEHITVVQGTLYFAVGDKFGRAELRELKTGSYAFIPKGSVMFGYTPEAAIVQVHGVGPFRIYWRAGTGWQDRSKTLDSPDAANIFRFKKGDHVVTPRGRGHIRQGYDSGEVIAYEIQGDARDFFMAEECEIEGLGQGRSARPCFSRGEKTAGKKEKHNEH